MKKKTDGKLKLNRETVRQLEDPEMAGAAGARTAGPCGSINTYVCSGCRPCL
jgi:hypothetical protein